MIPKHPEGTKKDKPRVNENAYNKFITQKSIMILGQNI